MIEGLFVHTATISRPTKSIASKEYTHSSVAVGTVQCYIQAEGESLVDTPHGVAVQRTYSAFFMASEDLQDGDHVDWIETGFELVVRSIARPFASFGAEEDHLEVLLAERVQVA